MSGSQRNRPLSHQPPLWWMADPDEWLRHVLAIHFHPETGTPYWLERQRRRGLDVRREIRSRRDLPLLGPTDEADLARRPLEELVPRGLLRRREEWVVVETGGTLGTPKTTLYLEHELRAVFADPFTAVAEANGFPRGARWLFVGPGGPHVIGRAARENARALGSAEPFTLDFDPRWAKRLAPGSMARRRYLDHVCRQALRIVRTQGIEVLFSTPVMLLALSEELEEEHRLAIRGVFYGGLPLEPQDSARLLEAFPRAIHLAGYGNTLVGLALELRPSRDGRRCYFYPGSRLHVRLVERGAGARPARERLERARLERDRLEREVAVGERGQVVASRLDESFLVVNLFERDEATRLPAPATGAPWPVVNPGIGDPGPLSAPPTPARGAARSTGSAASSSTAPSSTAGSPVPATGFY